MTTAAATLAPARAHAQTGGCVVRSAHAYLSSVRVEPSDVEPVDVSVTDAPATLRPVEPGLAHVEVSGAIAFRGEASEVVYGVPAATVLPNPMVTLGHGVMIREARGEGADVEGVIEIGMDVTVRGARVPCGAIEPVEDRPSDSNADEATQQRTQWVPWHRRFVLRARPGGGAQIAVTLDYDRALPLVRLSEANGWMEVETAWTNGSRLHGWIPRSAARAEKAWSVGGVGYGGGVASRPRCGGRRFYCGPARVAPGTAVHAGRGRDVWGVVGSGEALTVSYRPGDAWAEITEARGLWLPPGCAWVRAESVTLPAGVRRR